MKCNMRQDSYFFGWAVKSDLEGAKMLKFQSSGIRVSAFFSGFDVSLRGLDFFFLLIGFKR